MTTTGNYKGNPTITLNADDRFPFTFGIAKARLILENIKAIEAFVKANTPKQVKQDTLAVGVGLGENNN